MINIILIILFVNTLIQYIRIKKGKVQYGAFFCGIWCYVGDEPADSWKLRILALFNLSRGDHATGICVNDTVFKDTVDAKDFLVSHGELFDVKEYDTKNFTILGHCRQATYVYDKSNKEFAHPHAIKRKADDKRPFLIGVHNGTISNLYDLADKYDLDYNTNKYSDSMQIFTAITKGWETKNMEVLKDYEGSATIVFYPVAAKNTLYVHRDKARELFYWSEGPNKTYISSIKNSLIAIGANPEDVKEFKSGWLFKFTNGHITKKWDLSDKKPYSKPRHLYSTPAKPKNLGVNRNGTPHTKSKEGFYWDDHRIYNNGHLFTGELFIEKNGRRVEKTITSNMNVKDFNRYYCVMGIIMKDRDNYTKLWNRCSDGQKFAPEKFKKLVPSEVASYALYPVLGKFYESSKQKFFWHEKLEEIKDPSGEPYAWSPPLSGKEFKANRAGLLLSENSILGNKVLGDIEGQEMTSAEAIRYLIDKATTEEKIYDTVGELFHDYKNLKKINVVANTFDMYMDDLLDVLKDFGHISKTDISAVERSRWIDDYGWTEDAGVATSGHLLSELLATTCRVEITKAVRDQNNRQTTIDYQTGVTDLTDDEIDDDKLDSEELIGDSFSEDAEYFKSSNFKNAFLFSNYDSLDDAMINYVQTDELHYVKSFLLSLNELFYDLSIIDEKEFHENKSQSVKVLKSRISSTFDLLKCEPFYQHIFNSFVGSNTDIHEAIRDLVDNISVLDNKMTTLTSSETVALKVYKLCLSYLKDTAKTLSYEKLKQLHNITERDLEHICQS